MVGAARLSLAGLSLLPLLLQLSLGSAPPTITEPPMDTEVLRGQTITLTCRASGDPQPTITWELANGIQVGNADTNGGPVLIFNSAATNNAGVYVCVATNDVGIATANATVVVNYAPIFNFLGIVHPPEASPKGSSPGVVMNNTLVVMDCNIGAHPPPTISWFHNGNPLQDSSRITARANGTLIISPVRLVDAGMYSCRGVNSLGSVQSPSSRMLMVYSPPVGITIQTSPRNLDFIEIGASVNLTCEAISSPAPTYTWWFYQRPQTTFNGPSEAVILRESETMENLAGVVSVSNGVLRLLRIRREHSGYYFCNASNDHGSVRSRAPFVEIKVVGLPPPPASFRVAIIESSRVRVRWVHLYSVCPPILRYEIEYKLDSLDSIWEKELQTSPLSSQDLQGLLPNAYYWVRSVAYNQEGYSNMTSPIHFRTHPGVPMRGNKTENFLIRDIGPRYLTLEWTVDAIIRNTSYNYTKVTAVDPNSHTQELNVWNGSVTLNGLTPVTSYNISLTLVFVGGYFGPPLNIALSTAEDAPDTAPENLTVVNVTAFSLTISWEPPSIPNGRITNYTVSYEPLDGSDDTQELIVNGDTFIAMLRDLLPFTNYSVGVSASTDAGEGPQDFLEEMTLQAAPPPPIIVSAVAPTSTSLWILWRLDEEDIPGILANYTITYSSADNSHQDELTLPPSSPTGSLNLMNLLIYTSYEVCVSAATEGGGRGEANCTSVRTLGAAPDLTLVLSTLVPSCPPSLTVSWQPVTSDLLNGPVKEAMYSVMWESGEGSVAFSPDTTSYEITGLLGNTEYNVTVVVTNSHGPGPASNFLLNSTYPPASSPYGLTFSRGSYSLAISWSPPFLSHDPVLSYSVSYAPVGRQVETETTSNTFITLSDLSPFTMYLVTVRAVGSCGQGEPVNRSISTLPLPPEVSVVSVSPNSVAVQWTHPQHFTGLFEVRCGGGKSEDTLDTKTYHVCKDLQPNMPVTVWVWSVATDVGRSEDAAIVNATTSCDDVKVKVEEKMVSVEIGSSEDCPEVGYVLVMVQEVNGGAADNLRPLATYSVEELVSLTDEREANSRRRRQDNGNLVYIAANLSSAEFSFELGDEKERGGYKNLQLRVDQDYNVGILVVPDDASLNVPAVFAMIAEPFEVEPEESATTKVGSSNNSPEIPAVAIPVAVVVGMLLLVSAIFCVSIFVCCRQRRGDFSPVENQKKTRSNTTTTSLERSSSVRISGRRGNKPTDPVEEYRVNYRTEALECHPPVPTGGFVNKLLVMRTNDNQLFLEEFGSIEMNPQQPCSLAELPGNRNKNRYNNILPYDHSRVKLHHGKSQGDYINGSYCSGFMKVQGFIATQGCLPDTIPDFWRMVWEQNSHTIVMLTNTQERGKTKCEVYWPREVGSTTVFGTIEVTLSDFTQLADYTIRCFSLHKSGSSKEVREVRQFHFTSWPDHGVPQYATAMLAMVRRVQSFHSNKTGPMVVHCSAGVGRTGTFIVIYSMLERMKAGRQSVDIYGHVSLLRTQRNYMVQTEDQYFFIYEAVAEAIVCGNTEVTLEGLEDYVRDLFSVAEEVTDNTNIELQFKRLAVDKSDPFRFASANRDVNKSKNRYVNVLPYENTRVTLQYQRAQEGSDYINASFIDGYHYRNAFIATQGPLQNTLADFWRMVWEQNIPLIIMLTKCQEKGTERSAQYWPKEIGQTLSCGLYSVQMTVERKSEHYTYRDLVLVDSQSGRKRQVRHYHYLAWPEAGVPSSPIVLLDFLREVQKNFVTLNTKSPITVHCSNGIGRTGVFIALHIILERMVAEGLVDVFQTIKNLRIQRPAMVQTLEQYQFCYTATLDYIETSDLINQLKSSTRSDSRSQRTPSNASELRASRRSLARNDSLRSSTKRSSRNLELSQVSNGTSTVYGGSEATSTFGTSQQLLHPGTSARASLDGSTHSQGVVDVGDGSGTPVPSTQALSSHTPSAASVPPPPPLLANPQLAHLNPAATHGSAPFLSTQDSSSSSPPLRLAATSGSYQGIPGAPGISSGDGGAASAPPHGIFQTNTLPSRSSQHPAAVATVSQPSLGRKGSGGYPSPTPVMQGAISTSSSAREHRDSQDSLERTLANITLSLNSNSNNCVDVFVET